MQIKEIFREDDISLNELLNQYLVSFLDNQLIINSEESL